MKLVRTLVTAAAAVALSATALSSSALAQNVTLRLQQFLPPQATIPSQAITPWARGIESQSQGRIKIQMFPSMQMGGRPPELFDQARDGVVDIVWTVLGYTPGRFPKSEVFELPFTVGQAESGSRAFQEFVETHAMDEFKDVKLLAVHVHGPGLFHSRTPIKRLEDLSGMSIRGGSRVVNMMLEQLGATPVGMPVPAVSEALSKGVITATTVPLEVVPPLRIHELVRNHTGFSGDTGLYTQTFGLVMNKGSYDRLPADLKKIIDQNSGAEVAALFGRAMDQGDVKGLQLVKKAGNNIITLDEAETARWKKAAGGVRKSWFDEVAKRDIDGPALADAAGKLVAKHAGR